MTSEELRELADEVRCGSAVCECPRCRASTYLSEQAEAMERERCAKVADAADKSTHPAEIADLIRALPDEETTNG